MSESTEPHVRPGEFTMHVELGEAFINNDPGQLLRVIRQSWVGVREVGTVQADSGPVDLYDSDGNVIGWWHIAYDGG